MIRTVLVKVTIGLIVSAGLAASYLAVEPDVSATPPRDVPMVAPTDAPAAPIAPSEQGAAAVGIDDDGLRLRLGSQGQGAGVELTGEGMQVWVEGDDGQGHNGSAGAGMDADGMRVWLDGGF